MQRLLESHWVPRTRLPQTRLPAALAPWLLDPQSLTRRLLAACDAPFAVQVVSQAWERPQRNEVRRLGLAADAHAWVRQVRLHCGPTACVFARTVIPVSSLTGPRRHLARLGNRPLGAVLFADPALRRGGLDIVRCRPGERLYAAAAEGLAPPPAEIWGRRSLFLLRGHPLLVCELFLPPIAQLRPPPFQTYLARNCRTPPRSCRLE